MHFMRPRHLVFALAAVGVSVLAFACSSRDDDWSYDGPRSSCSTGAPYDLGTNFAELRASEAASKAPECIPRCGERQGSYGHYGISWSVAALPSGACSYDGEVCSMTAVRTRECPDGRTVACSLTGYACRCENGNWRCYSGIRGASACLCPTSGLDASASDGAADASSEAADGGDTGKE